ncbi:MAG TPA: hypothetical protein VD927_08165 [Chryseosolibacter sp.]|nr:hypothetical protein [Chryseosolibacter sp.]
MKVSRAIFNFLRFNSRNWKAVVLCILAATVFWFFNALNKTYTTNLRFPLTFAYDEQNFVPVKSLPENIRLNVTGNGWALFRRSAGLKVPPLEIPLERPTETKRIVGSTLPPFFTNQLDGMQINFVLADTIHIDLEPKKGRWLKLAIDSMSLDIKDGFGLASDISILPDSIFIEGPRPVVNAVQEPFIMKIPFEDIQEPFMEELEVKVTPAELIRREPPTVAVMFTVEKFVTITDSVQLKLQNTPPQVSAVIGNNMVAITIRGPENILSKTPIDSLKAVVDLKGFKRGEKKFLPSVDDLPPYSRIISIDSVSVKF